MAKVSIRYSTAAALRLPLELETRLRELALPPNVAQRFRELALSPDAVQRLRLELPPEWEIPPDVMQAAEEAAQRSGEAAPPAPETTTQAATECIPTEDWWDDVRKKNPKRKGEKNKVYAKRLHGMQPANVTRVWSEGTCLRHLFPDRTRDGSDLSDLQTSLDKNLDE
jgi:hypothetical protein